MRLTHGSKSDVLVFPSSWPATPERALARGRRGMSLVEVLVASIILAVVGIPVLSIFITSKQEISRSDIRHTKFFYAQEILTRVQRQALHDLWDNFGPQPFSQGRLRDRLADLDASGKLIPSPPNSTPANEPNPLGFTQDFVNEMRRDGLDGQIEFEFYSRRQLGLDPSGPLVAGKSDPKVGIAWMQAGYTTIRLLDRTSGAVVHTLKYPLMCPAIVGRPGLKLSSCPAIDPDTFKKYAPLLAAREAALSGPDATSAPPVPGS